MKNARKAAFPLLICVSILLFVICGIFYNAYMKKQSDYLEKDIQFWPHTLYGYTYQEGTYINTIGDAHIQLPEINAYIDNISLFFSEPLPQELNITVYYAVNDYGYSEEYTSSAIGHLSALSATINISTEMTTCQIDIGDTAGQSFALTKILLNDSDAINSNNKLNLFRFVIIACLILVLEAGIYLLFFFKFGIEQITAGIVLILGLFYAVVITPLSGPDEPHHYQSSYQLSNALLFQWETIESADSADFDYSRLSGHNNVSSAYLRMIEEIDSPAIKGETIEIPYPRSLQYFPQYLPQALGIAWARITNRNFIQTFLIGRISNLLFYVICIYFTVKRAPKFKLVFCVVSLLPMSLHQAASYSYDSFINGVSLFLLASIVKGIYEEGLLSKGDWLAILLSGALLAPAKIVYAPLLLLSLLIPKSRFDNGRDRFRKIGLIWLIAIFMLLLFQIPSIIKLSGVAESSSLNWEGYHNYTLSYIISNPIETISIFWNTLHVNTWWLAGSVGQYLSGLTLVLPTWIIYGFYLIMIASTLNLETDYISVHVTDRVLMFTVSVMVILLTMLSMFLGWTSDFRTTISGVQGRYFTPLIPLVLLSLNNQIIVLRKSIDKQIIAAAIFLQTMSIVYIVNFTISR